MAATATESSLSSSASSGGTAARRLLKELKDLSVSLGSPAPTTTTPTTSTNVPANQTELTKSTDPADPVLRLEPASDHSLFEWVAVITSCESDSPYQGGKFKLSILVPHDYPMSPPAIKFTSPVCHPNVHWKTGEICLDLLKTNWSPAWTLKSACTAISLLLDSPEPDSPLNCDAANLLRCNDRRAYESLVKMYVALHCNSD